MKSRRGGALQEEESKLLPRHAHKARKSWFIELQMPNTTIPAFKKWHRGKGYETRAQRDQALHDLRKASPCSGLLVFEYSEPSAER